MNTAHWHLVLNHFPIIGTMVTGILLTIAIFTKNKGMTLASYCTLIVLSILGFIAFQTGEGAEEAIEGITGINKHALHEHEESADISNIMHLITGAFSVLMIFIIVKNKASQKWLSFLSLLIVYVTIGFMSYTGYLGGQIRHTEVNTQTQNNPNNSPTSQDSDD